MTAIRKAGRPLRTRDLTAELTVGSLASVAPPGNAGDLLA